MAASTSTLLLLTAFLLCGSCSTAFNITDILNPYPEFSTFNNYLTLTGDAEEINRRQTITVFAVNNAAMSSIMGQPLDVIKNVLGVHVVLDYYDLQKFQTLSNGTALLVTMFQASGLANGQMGFVNATVFPWGIVLGSAVPGAGLNSNLVQSVFAEPYNISVLQVSSLIVPPGIAGTAPPLPPPPPMPAPIPAAAPPKSAPPPKKTPPAAPTPSAPKPAHAPKRAPSTAPTPAATPSAPSPHPKESPTAAPTAPEPTPSNPASPPFPSAFPPISPSSESPVEPPAAAGTPSSGLRVAVGEGLAIAAAAMGAAFLVAF
ncbi:hypothetical protein Taro_017900 [Colocasia esculenta]|uniref:FAS1 domain-containing protein n=1 Tax=Colocasia esculenta TaxID=4460 RepID=A0A843V0U1_COLES|nr:hypothetical protein [Colocasia esculenta]